MLLELLIIAGSVKDATTPIIPRVISTSARVKPFFILKSLSGGGQSLIYY